jgi:glycosyltransferase involved in cell wall biosynthesis
MKVVWLCSFSLNNLRKYTKIHAEISKFHAATWIDYMIQEIKKRNEIDLHVITSSPYIKKELIISEKNITYHVLKRGVPFVHKGFPDYFRVDSFSKYFFLRKKLKKKILQINPDVINSHGTEDVYSIVLNDMNYPSIIWMQTYMEFFGNENLWIRIQKKIEKKVFQRQNNFILNTNIFENLINKINPKAKFYFLSYPVADISFEMNENKKDADICYVGSTVKRKGIEDLIDVTKIMVKKFPDLKVKVIGGHSGKDYMNFLKSKINFYNISKNIEFFGFLPEHKNVLKELKKSKLFMLPTYIDAGPRVVAESMALKVPVISYNIGGLPWMIGKNERGVIVEKGNINDMAEAAISLLEDNSQREVISNKAYLFARENFYSENIIDKLLCYYKSVINDFHNFNLN